MRLVKICETNFSNSPAGLRNIADKIERSILPEKNSVAVVLINEEEETEVFGLGERADKADTFYILALGQKRLLELGK